MHVVPVLYETGTNGIAAMNNQILCRVDNYITSYYKVHLLILIGCNVVKTKQEQCLNISVLAHSKGYGSSKRICVAIFTLCMPLSYPEKFPGREDQMKRGG